MTTKKTLNIACLYCSDALHTIIYIAMYVYIHQIFLLTCTHNVVRDALHCLILGSWVQKTHKNGYTYKFCVKLMIHCPSELCIVCLLPLLSSRSVSSGGSHLLLLNPMQFRHACLFNQLYGKLHKRNTYLCLCNDHTENSFMVSMHE